MSPFFLTATGLREWQIEQSSWYRVLVVVTHVRSSCAVQAVSRVLATSICLLCAASRVPALEISEETFREAEVFTYHPGTTVLIYDDRIACSFVGPGTDASSERDFDESYVLERYKDFQVVRTPFRRLVLLKDDRFVFLLPPADRPIFGARRLEYRQAPPPMPIVPFDGVSVSTSLTETIRGEPVTYGPENLSGWDITRPWVEGAPGDGIGETLYLTTRTPAAGIVIFSGFVDPQNLDLYYANARPRALTVAVEGGTEFAFELKDTPDAQYLELPVHSSTFTITIESAYPGHTYEDLAIAGIFVDRACAP